MIKVGTEKTECVICSVIALSGGGGKGGGEKNGLQKLIHKKGPPSILS